MVNQTDAKQKLIFETCLLLIKYFKILIQYESETGERSGYHSRIFDHFLHPHEHFIYIGKSEKLFDDVPRHCEHIVPCIYIISELERLLKTGQYSDEELAHSLQKNWKIAHITKEEAKILDYQLKLKTTMPNDWDFMTSDPNIRLEMAGIKLIFNNT